MKRWKIVFAVAAVFNMLVGLPLVLAPGAFYGALGQAAPDDILSVQTAGLLIAVFGVGYAMVARDPPAHRAIVWLGVIGKTPLPILTWLQIQAGKASMDTLFVALGDWVFVGLFLAFLLTTRRSGAS
jgi:hypothetical protein